MIYVTLSAWNMNSRGAKLSNFIFFKDSIIKNKRNILKLRKCKLGKIDEKKVMPILKNLFFNLNLVAKGKPKLVTFSKTMHFLLPNLVVPIDRTYTLNFFYGNTYVPKKEKYQFKRFEEIFNNCNKYGKKIKNFKKDEKWNHNIPKIIDNIIIGYVRLKDN